MAYVLGEELLLLGMRWGVERLGFFTLTFADPVKCIKEAQRRFNSLNTHVLKARYTHAIGVWERQTSGRIHFHLVVVLGADIRTGFDFRAAERGDYRSANQVLRAEWAFWRKTCPKYGFGRHELLPVKSTVEGIARYVGKYVSKHIRQRAETDKGARVVRFIGYKPGERKVNARFAWNTDGGWLWRHKLKAWCQDRGIEDTEALKTIYGPRWCWKLKEAIAGMRIDETFPSYAAACRSLDMEEKKFQAKGKVMEILESREFVCTYLVGERVYKAR